MQFVRQFCLPDGAQCEGGESPCANFAYPGVTSTYRLCCLALSLSNDCRFFGSYSKCMKSFDVRYSPPQTTLGSAERKALIRSSSRLKNPSLFHLSKSLPAFSHEPLAKDRLSAGEVEFVGAILSCLWREFNSAERIPLLRKREVRGGGGTPFLNWILHSLFTMS
jgi:hypothetical protein